MRLLERDDTGGIGLTEDLPNSKIPPYAILSHTWGDGEVLFRDLTDGTGKNKAGYAKIRFCGDQAWRDGLKFFWVDTCCIDKSNSVELQEVINSMFRWYRNATNATPISWTSRPLPPTLTTNPSGSRLFERAGGSPAGGLSKSSLLRRQSNSSLGRKCILGTGRLWSKLFTT